MLSRIDDHPYVRGMFTIRMMLLLFYALLRLTLSGQAGHRAILTSTSMNSVHGNAL